MKICQFVWILESNSMLGRQLGPLVPISHCSTRSSLRDKNFLSDQKLSLSIKSSNTDYRRKPGFSLKKMRQILPVNYTFKSTSPPKNAENTVNAGFDFRVTGTHQIWLFSLKSLKSGSKTLMPENILQHTNMK